MPAYLQIASQIREAVRLGQLEPGAQLPTVRNVVAATGVNPNTVVKAYREVASGGLVESRSGMGTFVLDGHLLGDRSAAILLRRDLRNWVVEALAQGLEVSDMHAVLTSIVAEQTAVFKEGAT